MTQISYLRFNLLFVLLFISSVSFAQLPLNGAWKYSFTDEKESAQSAFDDSSWKTTESSKLKWDQELPKTSNIVWIRKKVVIPSSLKTELEKTGALMLYFGRIKQEDKVYFNGEFIGETNSGDIKRAYLLSEKNILWDKENTIAVRISHWGGSASVETSPVITAATAQQLFIMNAKADGVTNKQQVKGINATYNSTIQNKGGRTVNATMKADFYDLDSKKIKSVTKNITIKPGDNTYSFPYKSPSAFLKIQYSLSIPIYNYNGQYNAEYGYINIAYKQAQPIIAYKVEEVFNPALLGQQNIEGWLGEKLNANKEQRLYKPEFDFKRGQLELTEQGRILSRVF